MHLLPAYDFGSVPERVRDQLQPQARAARGPVALALPYTKAYSRPAATPGPRRKAARGLCCCWLPACCRRDLACQCMVVSVVSMPITHGLAYELCIKASDRTQWSSWFGSDRSTFSAHAGTDRSRSCRPDLNARGTEAEAGALARAARATWRASRRMARSSRRRSWPLPTATRSTGARPPCAPSTSWLPGRIHPGAWVLMMRFKRY